MRTEKQILTDFFNIREKEERNINEYKKIYKIMKKIIIENDNLYKEILMSYILN
jgi:hypothetical protein